MSKHNRFASSELTAGQLNALVKKIGGEKNVRKFLNGKLSISLERAARHRLPNGQVTLESLIQCVPTWHEKNGVVNFLVEYERWTYSKQLSRLMGSATGVDTPARGVFSQQHIEDIPPTKVVTKIAVFTGAFFKAHGCKTIGDVCRVAAQRRMSQPSIEVVGVVCEAFTNSDIGGMGISHMVFMHRPSMLAADQSGRTYQLVINTNSRDRRLTASKDATPDSTLDLLYPRLGLAFEVSTNCV